MKSSEIEPIETKFAPEPVGPYNQAVLVENWLYCSGQIALDPSTGEMIGDGSIEEETKQVLKNLMAVVEAAGGKSSNVIRRFSFSSTSTVLSIKWTDLEVGKILKCTLGTE